MAVLAALVAMGSRAQNDNSTWSGKLSVYGTEITLVFHLDGENCTMDSPDQYLLSTLPTKASIWESR